MILNPVLSLFLQINEAKEVVSMVEGSHGALALSVLINMVLFWWIWRKDKEQSKEREFWVGRVFESFGIVNDAIRQLGKMIKSENMELYEEKFKEVFNKLSSKKNE